MGQVEDIQQLRKRASRDRCCIGGRALQSGLPPLRPLWPDYSRNRLKGTRIIRREACPGGEVAGQGDRVQTELGEIGLVRPFVT